MPGEREQRSVSNGNTTSQASIDHACLPIGCSVSAKYRGAFCSAQVKSIDKQVKIKVTLLESGEMMIISEEQIVQADALRVGNTITVRIPITSIRDHANASKQQYSKKQAIIKQITDNSIYTVVFNDGDETSLRRASLCLQGVRLYQNHTGQSKVSESRSSSSRSNLAMDVNDTIPIVCVRRIVNDISQAFPALVLKRKALPDYLWVRSFLDGQEYIVHQQNDVQPYRNNPEMQALCRSTSKQATQACDRFIRYQQTPTVWQKKKHQSSDDSSDHDCPSSSSDDDDNQQEKTEQKDAFVAKLFDFMDNRGSPINTIPKVHGYDLDLHRLFNVVLALGGSNKVTKNHRWGKVHRKMGLPDLPTAEHGRAIEQAYKKYLLPFESLTKKLGNLGASDSYIHRRAPVGNDYRRSLIRCRSKTVDEPEPNSSIVKKSQSSSLSQCGHRSSSSSESNSSELQSRSTKKQILLERVKPMKTSSETSTRRSRRRSLSLMDEDPTLKPILKIRKLSSETLNDLSPTNHRRTSSSHQWLASNSYESKLEIRRIELVPSSNQSDKVSSTRSSSGLEIPSIFQTLLSPSGNKTSSSSNRNSTSTDNRPVLLNRLNYEDIHLNDQLLIKEDDHDDENLLHYVDCLEKNDEMQKILVSFQNSESKERRWIGMEQVLQRQPMVKIDPIPTRSNSTTDDERIESTQINATSNQPSCIDLTSSVGSNSTSPFQAEIRSNQISHTNDNDLQKDTSAMTNDSAFISLTEETPQRSTWKRRYTHDSRQSKDSSPSTSKKNKNQADSTQAQDDFSTSDNKRQRIHSKRSVKRTNQQQMETSTEDSDYPMNNQLRQRIEEMFKNRPSRYNFLEFNEHLTGDHRLEQLRGRLRQCQTVFFNLQLALSKIGAQKRLFVRLQQNSSTPSINQ